MTPGAFSVSELRDWAQVARRMSQKKATKDNKGRALRGLAPKHVSGNGGEENFITAMRSVLERLVDDGLWSKNPAQALSKPARGDSPRRALRDGELRELFELAATSLEDPELDVLLLWFHLETGARRGGALNLRLGHLKAATQMIQLFERRAKYADQPVSAELISALHDHAVSRGGSRCDTGSADYDPSAPVFYFKAPTPSSSSARPLTSRHYDRLHERIQRELPWAAETHRAHRRS